MQSNQAWHEALGYEIKVLPDAVESNLSTEFVPIEAYRGNTLTC